MKQISAESVRTSWPGGVSVSGDKGGKVSDQPVCDCAIPTAIGLLGRERQVICCVLSLSELGSV